MLRRTWIKLGLTTTAVAALTATLTPAFSQDSDAPAPTLDIVDTAVQAGSFNTLVAAVQAAELVDALKGDGPFTVLAPTDEAFAALPNGTLESLLEPENKDQLTAILTYHVIPAAVNAGAAAAAENAETLNGQSVNFGFDGGQFQVNGVNIVATDIQTTNGVIHVIDAVLIPESKSADQDNRKSVQEVAARAIERGAPLYNHGDHAACAAVYASTLEALAAGDRLSDKQRRMVLAALSKAEHQHRAGDRAWTYRGALDGLMDGTMLADAGKSWCR